jgi:alkaline phosphatase
MAVRATLMILVKIAVVAAAVAVVQPAVPEAQAPAATRARNVILFIADAGGIPTLNAASLHGYGAPRQLFIQKMPHIGLSDTSPVGAFVSDSAAGMTAIVTGRKTKNGVISQSAAAERKVKDGEPLKTILEYAEERGLSTGVISNDAITGATPAALYAKVNERGMTSAIFQQLFEPKAGDGPDVVIGAGRPAIAKALAADTLDIDVLGQTKGRPVLRVLDDIPAGASRALVVHESAEFDPLRAAYTALGILSKNPAGFFLAMEWDTHTDNVRRGLDRMVALDRVVEFVARTASRDTLIIFTADHSFDLRVRGGSPLNPLLDGLLEAELKAKEEKRTDVRTGAIRMENSHTSDEVLVAAQGPNAERVRGYLANTDLFWIMMDALGWPAN